MFAMEVYAAVRRFVFVDCNGRREAARVFGLSRETVLKMCRFSLPPGYTRKESVAKPKLGRLLGVTRQSWPAIWRRRAAAGAERDQATEIVDTDTGEMTST